MFQYNSPHEKIDQSKSNNTKTICTENTECILVTNQENESAGQNKTTVCNSNIKHNKKKPDIYFEMEIHKCCSLPIDKVFWQELNEGEDHSSAPNSILAAIQVGKSWKFPANLTLVHFCVDFDKVFAMCHKNYIPKEQKCISLYQFDATSGKLEKIIPLY